MNDATATTTTPKARNPRPRRKRARRGARSKKDDRTTAVRHTKSRPVALAQMCLAFEKHALRCQASGEPFQLTPQALLKITHDQAGSKTHHPPQIHNDRDAQDPLHHILSHTTLCGAGDEASVFRPDIHHYGIRVWPEGCLIPILADLDRMEQEWNATEPSLTANTNPTLDRVDELIMANHARNPPFAPARPLW